jgi:tetratricopeptide (TPR) repeat protein
VIAHCSEALRLARAVREDRLAAAAEKQLAVVELDTNREEAARDHAVRALSYYRQTADRWMELEVLEVLAVVEYRLGRHPDAWSYGGAALSLGGELPNREPGVLCQLVRGAAAIEMGRFEDARSCLEEALARATEIGDVEHADEALEMLNEI